MNSRVSLKVKNVAKQYLCLTPWMRTITLSFAFSIVVIHRLGEDISQVQFV